ncbi:sugar ABC transporter substrate-binding protein [Vallitalea pronyensis]|uniref:Sugar ABC transporter substrate-binding protein n=1 Tax=Vallitalea pronyensis TaxID=1348613 RepID=A0A8J8MJ08_9FIRM|nr:sugar ABC transporter substrate-binding protein [Vallitalea pronyensis]QUI22173.1 sugar ABC transporter substrate-binding protein [Vallitalea pronyensis]
MKLINGGKRLFSLLLVVFLLAACSSEPKKEDGSADTNQEANDNGTTNEVDNEDTNEDTNDDQPSEAISGKIVYSAWGNAEEKKMEEDMIAAFKKAYPEVEVEYIHVDGNYEQKLQTMIAGGTTPDVMAIGGGHVATFQAAFQPITMDNVDTSKYISDTLVKGLSIDGVQYALPKRVNTKVMAYNMDLLQEAGVDIPVGDVSLDEFVTLATDVSKLPDRDGLKIYGSDPLWAGQVIYQHGGRLFTEDGKTSLANSKEVIDAVQYCIDAYKVHGFAPSPAESSGVNMMDMFLGGYVGFKGDFGPYFLPLLEEVTSLNWDITSPAGQGGEMEIVGIALSGKTKNKAAAEAFVTFVSTSAEAQRVVANGANLPVTNDAKEVFVNRMPDKNLEAFFEAMTYEVPQPMITEPEVYGTFYKALFDRTELGNSGKEDVATVLEEVKKEMDAILN